MPPTPNPSFATLGPDERREQMSARVDGLRGARRMAREMGREKQKERGGEGDKGGVNAGGLVRGRRLQFESDMGDSTGGEIFLSTREAFTIDPTLGTLLAGPKPTLTEINSLMHDPTFPPTADSKFATLSPQERRKQMSDWADELPGARRLAKEMEREKQKEREREGDKGDVNVEGVVRGGRFKFGYDMDEITLANESEISENHSDNDESPRPTITKDTISSNSNFYNIPSHQRRYRLQRHPSSYNHDRSSDKKKQAMTKLWLEQNPTLVFRLPSPKEDDDDDDAHAQSPMQVRRVASGKGDDAHPPAANSTRVWRVPFPSNEKDDDDDDDDDAAHAEEPMRVRRVASLKDKDDHARPEANPARVWRVPSPIDDDDDIGNVDANDAPLPTGPTAANEKRHARHNTPRVVREVRMGRHIVTSPGDVEWVSEDLIVSRGGGVQWNGALVEKQGGDVENKGADVEKKSISVERKGAGTKKKGARVERNGAGIEKKGAGVVKKVRSRRNAKKISAEVEETMIV